MNPANRLARYPQQRGPRFLPPRFAAGDPAAWYDGRDLSSMVVDGSNRVSLWADKSGNSATKMLCLNGVSGNNASISDSAALNTFGAGAIDVRFYHPGTGIWDWTPAATQELVCKWDGGASKKGYLLRLNSLGFLTFLVSGNGTTEPGDTTASAQTTLADNQPGWVRVTYVFATGKADYYQSTDGVSWTAVGTQQTASTPTTPFVSNTPLYIGNREGSVMTGNVGRVQIYNGVAGTLVFDADFSTAAKLATSFVCATGQTVTINTSGATGARISGARDLVNLTLANQPIWSAAGITFDGTSRYVACAGFPLAQPISHYFTGQQVTWVATRVLFDGRTITTLQAVQTTGSPQLNISAGSSVAANTGLAVAATGLLASLFSGASSSLRVNRNTATTGNAGTGTPNGITLGSTATPTLWANILAGELIVYPLAHDVQAQNRMAVYESLKLGFAA